MSFFTFGKNVAVAKLGDTGDAITAWYARHDPATASLADITELGQRADALAHRIAEIEGTFEHDQKTVTDLQAKLKRDLAAATALGTRLQALQASSDPSAALAVTTLTAQVNAVVAEIKQIGGDDGSGKTSGMLFDANATLASDTEDLTEFRAAHTKAVADWTGAQTRLQAANSASQRATLQERAAKDRLAQVQRDQGLMHGSQAGHVALDALEAQAEKAKQGARAAQIQTDALRHSGGSDVDSIVNAALTGDMPTTPTDKATSALDALRSVTGG